MPLLTLSEADELAAAALRRCHTSEGNAATVAKALVRAEAEGLASHGLLRLPIYAAQTRAGKIDGHATPTVEEPRPALLWIDARNGFACPALDEAVRALPKVARLQGLAAAAIRRSHHCGVAGHPVRKLADAGMVAMLFANAPAAMAPWGGKRAVFGTDPIAFGCPVAGHEPIVVDMSLSKVARGNILTAMRKGEPIPEGWAFDSDGNPTTDPEAALAGTMVPLGDAKGTALALMVELLAAGLSGAFYAYEASSFLDAEGPPPGTGQFIIAIDAAAFGDSLNRFAALAAAIEEQPGARLPGTRRAEYFRKAEQFGLNVSDRLIAEINAL